MKIYKKKNLMKENKIVFFITANLIKPELSSTELANLKQSLKLIFLYNKLNKKILLLSETEMQDTFLNFKKNIRFYNLFFLNDLKIDEINKQNLVIGVSIEKKIKLIKKIVNFSKLIKQTTIVISSCNNKKIFKKNFADYSICLKSKNSDESKKMTWGLLKAVL